MYRMKKESFFQVMRDGTEVFVTRYIPDGEVQAPRGLLQISHGMLDHSARYEDFCRFMCGKGFVVNAHDHRGHGQTGKHAFETGMGKLGYLSDKDGFMTVVDDLHEVIEKLKDDFSSGAEKKLPVYLFAHSWGSFIGQAFIEKYGKTIDKCVLCGSAGPRNLLINSGRLVTFLMSIFKKKTDESPFFRKLSFAPYNSRIKNPFSKNAWVCRDNNVVKDYDEDPFCTFVPTLEFYCELMNGLHFIHQKKNIERIPKNLPVFLIVGDADPVGEWAVTVEKLFKIYCKTGIKNSCLKVYPEARHELFNELNKKEVYDDVLLWLEKTT